MEMQGILVCLLALCLNYTSAQYLNFEEYKGLNICTSVKIFRTETLPNLRHCQVILGNLIVNGERGSPEYFKTAIKSLREVTGYVVFYRTRALGSLGQLFPNLGRIRGNEVLYNYALIVNEVPHLYEIGLYNLVKIDRGGVIISGDSSTYYVNTIDWNSIAPKSRHVLMSNIPSHVNPLCRCSRDKKRNYCWNNMHCQRFISDSDTKDCHEECLGCSSINSNQCMLCRHYTYQYKCVSKCPNDTLVIKDNDYCVEEKDCFKLNRFSWNGTCVMQCPIGYEEVKIKGVTTCKSCPDCSKSCPSLDLSSVHAIQSAAGCVFINGSLNIHGRVLLEAMEELRTYLKHVEEVSDYIHVYGFNTVSSLDFLSSLKKIHGRTLKFKRYSLVISRMDNLQSLFLANVTDNLFVGNGTLSVADNPVLCPSEIDKLKGRFPITPTEADIPPGNGYSGSCKEASLNMNATVLNETSARIEFTISNRNLVYSLIYVRIPVNNPVTIFPESCSDSEWFSVSIPDTAESHTIELNNLKPASTYAACIETYNPIRAYIARSAIINFTLPLGKPPPPFITELVASSDNSVVLRWRDRINYKKHILYYKLDASIIEIDPQDVLIRNHCEEPDVDDYDSTHHAVVMNPPNEYGTACESMCGIMATATAGALVQENFDICKSLSGNGCEYDEYDIDKNTTDNGYVRTISLVIHGQKDDYQVGSLAAYRDYRFRLRACSEERCSSSAQDVVRTLSSEDGDLAEITSVVSDDLGDITVSWKEPDVINGVVLAYYLEILPLNKTYFPSIGSPIPHSWCVLNNVTSLMIKTLKSNTYYIRVCTKTLRSPKKCGDWMTVQATATRVSEWWWRSGILSAIVLWLITFFLTKYCVCTRQNDEQLLIDSTFAQRNLSEPPAVSNSDFFPLYLDTSLRESQ